MWGLEMPITDHPLHSILMRESRLTVSEKWAQRHCSLVPASELDLASPDSAIGIFSTGTCTLSCEFILTHVNTYFRAASSHPAFPTVLLPMWFWAFLELPSRCWACGEGLCNFPCPLLPSAGDRWSLLFTLQFLALLATKMLLSALWTTSLPVNKILCFRA